MSKKIAKVIVLYGGRSTEHEISCRSAAFILRNLNPHRYDVNAVAIDRSGRWLTQDASALLMTKGESLPIQPVNKDQVAEAIDCFNRNALQLPGMPEAVSSDLKQPTIVFPMLHGTYGEDGTLQGLLELAGLAYVGSDTLGSAIGMDKVVAKRLAEAAGIPIVPYLSIRSEQWGEDGQIFIDQVIDQLGLPVFVKPANLGSSVGISKVNDAFDLKQACLNAFNFDDKILVEKALSVREIECAVIGDYKQLDVSIPGEVISHADFYTYEAKYIDAKGASIAVPADISEDKASMARDLSRKVFKALELYGLARVDLFLTKDTSEFYFNEVNTLPGFTSISQFPLLWKHSGLDAEQLLDRLIGLAIKRHDAKKRLQRTFIK